MQSLQRGMRQMIDDLPKIVVKGITENEDGSANMELDLDNKAVQLLLDIGLTRLLEEHLENKKNELTGYQRLLQTI